jgi:hypothetical protein
MLVHLERHLVADVVHLQRGPVLDRAPDAVVAEVPLLDAILQRPEVAMCVLHRLVDRRAGEPVAEPVLQLHAHRHRVALGALTLLRAMAFVHHADDVVARERGEVAHVLERLHGCHQRALPVGAELLLQVLDSERLLHVGIVAGVEVIGELRLQVAPVHHDEDRGVVQRRVPPQLLTGEDHGERLAGTLCVPDEARPILGFHPLARKRHRPIHQFVHRLELLVARDLLGCRPLLGLEDDEVLEEVEQVRGFQPE